MTGSSPDVGSSKSSRFGFAAIARAIATRRRWPPDSSDGIRSMYSLEPDKPEHLLDTAAYLSRAGMSVSS